MHEKNFNGWNKKKIELNNGNFNDYVHTREVWWCSLGLNIGFEQDGKHDSFERPVLVIKKFSNDIVLIVPLSSRIKDGVYYFNFTHDNKVFSALISQIRLISTKRLNRKIYRMDSILFKEIHNAIKEII